MFGTCPKKEFLNVPNEELDELADVVEGVFDTGDGASVGSSPAEESTAAPRGEVVDDFAVVVGCC